MLMRHYKDVLKQQIDCALRASWEDRISDCITDYIFFCVDNTIQELV